MTSDLVPAGARAALAAAVTATVTATAAENKGGAVSALRALARSCAASFGSARKTRESEKHAHGGVLDRRNIRRLDSRFFFFFFSGRKKQESRPTPPSPSGLSHVPLPFQTSSFSHDRKRHAIKLQSSTGGRRGGDYGKYAESWPLSVIAACPLPGSFFTTCGALFTPARATCRPFLLLSLYFVLLLAAGRRCDENFHFSF